MKELTLTQMKVGQGGTIVNIEGGFGVTRRLEVLGVRPGKRIVKVSSHFWRGPVTVKIGNSPIAIGYGMASKVLVEVDQ
jgi:ferrous iron transport protein A